MSRRKHCPVSWWTAARHLQPRQDHVLHVHRTPSARGTQPARVVPAALECQAQAAVGGRQPQVRPALEAAVMKGLARQPGDRQPTVSAFADDLEAALAKTKDASKSGGLLGRSRTLSASAIVNSSSDYYYLKIRSRTPPRALREARRFRARVRPPVLLLHRCSPHHDVRRRLAVVGGLGLDRMAVRGGVPVPSAVSRSAPIRLPTHSR